MGAVVKKEDGADPIYIISSDSDSEDMTQPPPQPCCSTVPSSNLLNLPTHPLYTPEPPYFCADPQLQNGHLPSSPAPQPSTRVTAAPPPVQPNPAGHPMSAPAPNFWWIVEKGTGVHFVICPCPNTRRCHNRFVKPKNLVKHMKIDHQVDPHSPQYKQLCQGCNLAVPSGELSAHIGCQEPSSPRLHSYLGNMRANWIRRTQLKRKATTSV